MRFSFATVAASALAGLASAYTTPVGKPSGNPILKPGLQEQVPAGKPYTITWTPTTSKSGTVTLVLLRGPSTNVQPLYPIVENAPNTGSYSWTPSTDLEDDVTHYGLQLIVDATGQYQYSTQFGISNKGGSTHPSSTASHHGGSPPVSQIGDGQAQVPTAHPTPSTSAAGNASSSATAGSSSAAAAYGTGTGTGTGTASVGLPTTVLQPTKSMTVPETLKTTKTTKTSAKTSSVQAGVTSSAVVTAESVPTTSAAATASSPVATGAAGKVGHRAAVAVVAVAAVWAVL